MPVRMDDLWQLMVNVLQGSAAYYVGLGVVVRKFLPGRWSATACYSRPARANGPSPSGLFPKACVPPRDPRRNLNPLRSTRTQPTPKALPFGVIAFA